LGGSIFPELSASHNGLTPAANNSTNASFKEAVRHSLKQSIRNTPISQLTERLVLEIEFCAKHYSGTDTSTEDFELLLQESYDFIISQFGSLSVLEVREAFRLAASGVLLVDLTAYYGRFNLQILGKVLKAYSDYRVEELKLASSELKQLPTKTPEYIKYHEQLAEERVEKLKLKVNGVSDHVAIDLVSISDYDFLKGIGKLNLDTGQKKEFVELAKPIYLAELKTLELTTNKFQRNSIKKLINDLQMEVRQSEAMNNLYVRAQRLIVVYYLQGKI
jgi:hypothetical protein